MKGKEMPQCLRISVVHSPHTWGYHREISKDIEVEAVNREICGTPALLVKYPMWDLTTLKKQYHIIALHGIETVMLHGFSLNCPQPRLICVCTSRTFSSNNNVTAFTRCCIARTSQTLKSLGGNCVLNQSKHKSSLFTPYNLSMILYLRKYV